MSTTPRDGQAGEARTCPSSPAVAGARLFGMRDDDGQIRPLRTALIVDEGFIESARRGGSPEARFRFAGPCVEGACKQWTGSACGVIARVMAAIEGDAEIAAEPLRPCPIRADCRWFAEHGAAACKPCRYVVTDPLGTGPPSPFEGA